MQIYPTYRTTISAALVSTLLYTVPHLSADSAAPPNDLAHQRPIPTRRIDYSEEISPLFSQYCLECHGPDKAAREGKFRLDLEKSAKGEASSGNRPIIPGNPQESELIKRIQSNDSRHRMPPEDAVLQLSPAQIELISQWISEGADYQGHWAYQPIQRPLPPQISDKQWPQQPLDSFILARLEKVGLSPSPAATKTEWLRRVYFDLTGLPPRTETIDAFVSDTSPSAYDRVVDRLLSSPRYGERWGRHWLDVARYGDSNGGDENHAFPHAYHYRNYVIDAFNSSKPFHTFLTEQLAGDLLNASPRLHENLERLKATGFLAIGTKILAEQDPVKKQADAVDELIDTVSKAVLGITIACARCHDHKFDPIPTKDYYAFAGIFHSSEIGNRPLRTQAFLKRESEFQHRLAQTEEQLKQAEQAWQSTQSLPPFRSIQAENFTLGNVQIDRENYGLGIGIISDPGTQKNHVEYTFNTKQPRHLAIEIRYAAANARPGTILIDGETVTSNAFSTATGGWQPENQAWHLEGVFKIGTGQHTLRFESEPMMVHIDQFRLIDLPPDSNQERTISTLRSLRKQRDALQAKAPKPEETMAVSDKDVKNVKIHIRGDHNSLGKEVPRGFLSEIGPPGDRAIPSESSGRKELAQWLTAKENPLTARVFVNRVWRWHFGRGIVETPDNFGTRGSRPTHPQLLDHLASEFVRNNWSVKNLHRTIVLSSTYQLSSRTTNSEAINADPGNRLYWKSELRRLEAEAFRDSLLFLSGRLSTEIGGGPMNVKSQDPSPKDLVKNREIYEQSDRRSVYLPVVRSNVYDFLTLLDFPNAATPVGSRSTTTVPTQALLLMNHDFVREEAKRILELLRQKNPTSPRKNRIVQLYRHLLGRLPEASELTGAEAFLANYGSTLTENQEESPQDSMAALCHTILMSNEFAYLW